MLDATTRSQIVAELIETYQTRKALPLRAQSHPQIEMEDA